MTHLLRSLIRETLLLEEVYGAQAVVYHGTSSDPQELISAILNDEFRPGEGAGSMYGKGLYTVYDPEGAKTMTGGYGDSIIKLKVNLYGYIIFDQDIAMKVYKRWITPSSQARKLGYSSTAIKALEKLHFSRYEYTSTAAYEAYESLQSEVKGLVFTGRNDGRVVVVYDPTTIVPIAWKSIGGEWQKADRAQSGFKSAVRRSATGAYEEGKYDDRNVKLLKTFHRLPINERIVTGNLNLEETTITSLPAGLKVGGDLNLNHTPITSLPAGLKVGGDLSASGTKITSLPVDLQVGGSLFVSHTALASLPKTPQVNKDIYLDYSKITSLPEGLKVNGGLYLTFTQIESLPAGLKVGSHLNVNYTKITSLPANLHVGGDLMIGNTQVKLLPADLKVDGLIWGFKGDIAKVPEHLKDKVQYPFSPRVSEALLFEEVYGAQATVGIKSPKASKKVK